MPPQVVRAGPSLVDVLNRVLDKGIVIDAWVRVSLVGIELVTVEARVSSPRLRHTSSTRMPSLSCPHRPPRQGMFLRRTRLPPTSCPTVQRSLSAAW